MKTLLQYKETCIKTDGEHFLLVLPHTEYRFSDLKTARQFFWNHLIKKAVAPTAVF